MKTKKDQAVFKLWNDAYEQYHQVLVDPKTKFVYYERYKYSEEFEMENKSILHISSWHEWEKVEKPYRMSKAWFVRDMTVNDLILGNYEKEPE